MTPLAVEWRAQQRAKGRAMAVPHRPVIASRPLEQDGSHAGIENARRRAEFYRRLYGQAPANIEIMRFQS